MANLSDYEVVIREHHVDSYGHVNNATYLALYEEARWEIITSQGYGFDKIHKLRQGPVILEVNLKFLKEIRLREKIRIKTEIIDYNSKIGRMRQQMIKESGDTGSDAIFVFGLFDMDQRKLIAPTEEWRKALGLG